MSSTSDRLFYLSSPRHACVQRIGSSKLPFVNNCQRSSVYVSMSALQLTSHCSCVHIYSCHPKPKQKQMEEDESKVLNDVFTAFYPNERSEVSQCRTKTIQSVSLSPRQPRGLFLCVTRKKKVETVGEVSRIVSNKWIWSVTILQLLY